tara:strand:- start:36 stop:422 length:387 start_codon:yes stop_codon:yes gene_type:complete
MEDQVRLAVLDQKLEDLKPVILKIDAAIEKLSEVNTTVSRMLAVHEERITKQEEIDTVLFAKIDKLRDKMDGDNDIILQRIRQLEKRVWMTVGALTVTTLIVNNSGLFSRLLTTPVETGRIESSVIEG